jgi:hypothetical protein
MTRCVYTASCVFFLLNVVMVAATAAVSYTPPPEKDFFNISIPTSSNKIGVVLTFWYQPPELIPGESASRIALFTHTVNVTNDTQFFEDVADFCIRNLIENCIDMGEKLHHWYLQEIARNPLLLRSNAEDQTRSFEVMRALDLNFSSYYNISVDSFSVDHSAHDAERYSFLSQSFHHGQQGCSLVGNVYDEYVDCPHSSSSESVSVSDTMLSRRTGDSITVVSGYWQVSSGHKVDPSHEGDLYAIWLNNTLRINMPYIIFADHTSLDFIADIRRAYPTLLVERTFDQFRTFPTLDPAWMNGRDVFSR